MRILNLRMKTLVALLALALFPLVITAQDVMSAEKTVASAEQMKVVTVMGVVNKDKDKLMLQTDSESYLLDVQFDEALIGKKVVATGVVTDENGVKMLKPQNIKVAK
ncbi:MAG: hypothetical protein CSA20_03355 [Deltaproteobacteria bacterium]|nr:MAG: hypothetical protein CSB23_02655 [Deltaproteobacteria bacterium]PIE73137.1 MAG: hypothetical protein CSA20_03355 [Deltaproteobacteria bacterium]